MKTGKFTQVTFARMLFQHGLEMEHYASDLFYDIKTMMNETDNGNLKRTFYLSTRPMGTHLTMFEHEVETYRKYNQNTYKIDFTNEGIIVTEI